MDPESTDADVVDLVMTRGDFVALLADGPMDRADVQRALDVSKSTAYRVLRELEASDLVRRRDGGFESTLFGSLALQTYRYFESNFATLATNRGAFTPFPATTGLDLAFVLDGELYTGDDVANPGIEMVERARTCDRFLAMAGVHRPELLDPLVDRLTHGDLEAEIVMVRDIFEYLQTYVPEKVEAVVETGNLALYLLDEGYPWGMTLTELDGHREVTVAVHDNLDPVDAVIVNDSERAVSRFREIFETYRGRSTRVTVPDL